MDRNTLYGYLFFAGIAALIWLISAPGRRQRKIRKMGKTATAVFISARQTGSRVGANYVLEIKLDVQQPGGSLLQCTTRSTVDPGWSLRPGDKLTVFVNPTKPDEVVLDKNTPPVYAAQNLR